MNFGKTKLELKVGIFVFIGLTILVVFVLSIGGFRTWSSGYRIELVFNFINGVKIGAPVRFAGVDVGEVEKIDLKFEPDKNHTEVHLKAWISDKVHIPPDSQVLINTLGLLGEKYVEIIPGENYAAALKEGQYLAGIDPIPTHEIFRRVDNIMNNLDTGITRIIDKQGTLGKLLYDDTVYNELEAFVTDVRKNPWKLLVRTREKN
ncbi:MAG: MlaD family protein [Candidatus Omnitrophica bacterium]|jgi:phospholipid/cholesterol/gamma-HCH transport system substrate-binding protein|nr:MlaD family protein [Candidatus Omnitrophota bacterium]MDD3274269.1 MlaD family protein [Candidatus Omnitrophota bacterium]MDD5077954.1 MlaD family protein [Candidatus Omnitrophota bacterium]